MERLEDRLAPAINTLDVGGLRFLSSVGFTEDGSNYVASTGTVAIGYKPFAAENFVALLQVDLQNASSSTAPLFSLNTNPTSPNFVLTNTPMNLVASGPVIPVWQPPSATPVSFDITGLQGLGLNLDDASSKPFEVAKVDFSLGNIRFANPDGGDTSDAQVKLQGEATFDNVPLVKDMKLKAEVVGTNFVIASTAGIELTGLEASKTLDPDATVAGMALTGTISIGYNHPSNSFTFGGTVSLTSKTQDGNGQQNGNVALNGIGAGLQLTVASGVVTELGFDIQFDKPVQIFGVSIATVQGEPVSFVYNLQLNQFEFSGGLLFSFEGNGVLADFGSSSDPGLIVNDGIVTKLDAVVSEDFKLFGADVATSPSLAFQYQRGNGQTPSQFIMYGALILTVSNSSISATMGTSAADPGLKIQDGKLTQLDLGITGTFSMLGMQVKVNTADVQWQSLASGDVLIISGDFEADFKAFNIDLKLGSDSNPNGLTIKDGEFQVGGITVVMMNADFGAFTVEELKVQWMPVGSSYDLDIDINLAFPGGFVVGGKMDFADGVLNDIALKALSVEGIPVADTGLFLTEIDASVQNLDNPSQLIVSGAIAFTFGETFQAFGQDVNLFRVEGDFTVDANELILEAKASLFAHSNDNGVTWKGLLGEGDAKLSLNWGDHLYALHVEVDGLAVFFDLKADLTFSVGKNVQFLAEADVVIPDIVPFIGGKELGGFGFYFDHEFQPPVSTTLAAWIDLHIIWDIEVGFEVVYDPAHPNGTVSLIGAGTINGFKQEAKPPVDQKYTYTTDLSGLVPANAAYATVHSDWSKSAAGVSILGKPTFRIQHTVNGQTVTYSESEFAANGIALIVDPNFATDTTKAVQIVGSVSDKYAPLVGDYQLLVDVVAQGGNPFPHFGKTGSYPDVLKVQATYHVPKPVFGSKFSNQVYVPSVPAIPTQTFPVTLQGNMDESFLASNKAKISLYRVMVQDPEQRPVLVDSVVPSQITGTGVNWQAAFNVPIDGLYPLSYVLYAVADDGFNVPVKTGMSAAFTPAFAVQGSVSNQLHDALSGWKVFLDYNHNGTHDSNEPITQTSSPDGFYAFAPTFQPSSGWSPVPVGIPFNVQLIVPSDQYTAEQNPVTITFDGSDTKAVSFTLQEKTAIQGRVFNDVGNNGHAADGTPLVGATVYIDANHNGHRDPGEVSALTNPAGAYSIEGLTAGTYTVALDVPSLSGPSSTAYSLPTVMSGNHSSPQALGMEFNVSNPVTITSLGMFDSNGDGFHGNLNAILYDRVTKKPVATLQFSQQEPGTLQGGFRFKTLAQPVTLYAGFQGLIVAEGFTSPDPWGDNNPVTGPTNPGANQLTFTGTGVYGPMGQYPVNVGGNQVPNPYMAGTFVFTAPTRVQSSPQGGTYTVTLDNSGYDVKVGNDFGVQPFSSISGTITGQQRSNGVLNPAAPQSGVTVNLIQNGIVVGSTQSGNGGDYTFSNLLHGAYSVEQVVPAGYRQITPFDSGLQLIQPTNGDVYLLPSTYPRATSPVIGDFDGNGKLDYAVLDVSVTSPTTNVWVFYNGDFSHPVGMQTNGSNPITLVAGHFQGTSFLDLAVLHVNGEVRMFANTNGKLSTSGVVIANLPLPDQYSGYVDMVVGNFFSANAGRDHLAAVYQDNVPKYGLAMFYVGGTVKLTVENAPTNLDGIAITASDINQDGISDIVAAPSYASPIVFYGDGQGGFTQKIISVLPGTFADGPVSVGDINGDGLPDIAIFDQNGMIHYTIQEADGTFPQGFNPGVGTNISQPGDLYIRDMDGDFRADFVWATSANVNDNQNLFVALNTGTLNNWFTPSFQSDWPLASPTNDTIYLTVGDIDGDGLNDVVVADRGTGQAELVHNRSIIKQSASIDLNIQVAQNPAGIDFNNAQTPKSIDHVLTMPANLGAGDWTIRLNGDRLEVRDRSYGLWSSLFLDDLKSLTIVGMTGRSNHVTLDMSLAGISLPGGIHFQGSTRSDDLLRVVLGVQDDNVSVLAGKAIINDMELTWTSLNTMVVKTGAGNDTLKVSGPLGGGTVSLSGGEGDDTYVIASRTSTINIYDLSGRDTLDFSQSSSGVSIDLARTRGQRQNIGAGNVLFVNGTLENLIGTAFADSLKGNAANNLILGGAGNDSVSGNGGRDILIGGLGRDILRGNSSDDLLIGGTTTFDADQQALQAVLAEWVIGRDYVARVKNLIDGTGSSTRRNGNTFLNRSAVLDDHAVDILLGGTGRDWFLHFPGDKTPDRNRHQERLGWSS